jgi:hypothetical protein
VKRDLDLWDMRRRGWGWNHSTYSGGGIRRRVWKDCVSLVMDLGGWRRVQVVGGHTILRVGGLFNDSSILGLDGGSSIMCMIVGVDGEVNEVGVLVHDRGGVVCE